MSINARAIYLLYQYPMIGILFNNNEPMISIPKQTDRQMERGIFTRRLYKVWSCSVVCAIEIDSWKYCVMLQSRLEHSYLADLPSN